MDNDQLILQHLMKISEDIGSIKSDLSNISESVSSHVKTDEEAHKKQEARIAELEDSQKKVKWMALGGGAVIAGLWRVVETMIGNGQH